MKYVSQSGRASLGIGVAAPSARLAGGQPPLALHRLGVTKPVICGIINGSGNVRPNDIPTRTAPSRMELAVGLGALILAALVIVAVFANRNLIE